MGDEDLELLITLDDPEGAPEEDTFNHQQTMNTLEHTLGQHCQPDERSDADIEITPQ